MQLHNLALKRAYCHALTQPLEAVHRRLYKAAQAVAAPLLPDAATQALARANGLVALQQCAERALDFFQWLAFLRGGITAIACRSAMASRQPRVS